MPWKVANLRLELDEPEAALPDKVSARLGVAPSAIARLRILRKSLDARRHDDLHFVYAAEVEVPDIDGRAPAPDVEPFRAEPFDWPEAPGAGPLRYRPVVI